MLEIPNKHPAMAPPVTSHQEQSARYNPMHVLIMQANKNHEN